MHSLLSAFGLTGFWLFSPEALVLIGNGGGAGAGAGIAALLIFSVVIFLGTSCLEDDEGGPGARATRHCRKKLGLKDFLGTAGMIGTTLFASTGMLVTAGFTFNEVFYYRFPNFAFAYLLLTFALALQFFPRAVSNAVLAAAAICSLSGLAALTVYGLISGPPVPIRISHETTSISDLLPLLLIFAGIDRARLLLIAEPKRFRIAFLFSVMLLAGWLAASSGFVESQKLIFSTIPYMTAAAKIAGDTGRMAMGLVIIMGSFWAVHGLLNIGGFALLRLSKHPPGGRVRKVMVILLAAAVGTLLAAGVAGTNRLELYIRSSLLLWLGYTALSVLSGALGARHEQPIRTGVGLIAGIMILGCSLTLFAVQEDVLTAALFAVSMIAVTALLVIVQNLIGSNHGPENMAKTKITEVRK